MEMGNCCKSGSFCCSLKRRLLNTSMPLPPTSIIVRNNSCLKPVRFGLACYIGMNGATTAHKGPALGGPLPSLSKPPQGLPQLDPNLGPRLGCLAMSPPHSGLGPDPLPGGACQPAILASSCLAFFLVPTIGKETFPYCLSPLHNSEQDASCLAPLV